MSAVLFSIGTDIVHIPPFALQLNDAASAFVNETFTRDEIAYANLASSGMPAQHLAARFAAKEATLKALDHACAARELRPPSVRLHEIEIQRDERGRPSLAFHGAAALLAETLNIARAQLSLSHDGDYAVAFVQLACDIVGSSERRA